MAMDTCSESPRISFSHDLLHPHHTDEPLRSDDSSDLLILDSTADFNFCTNGSETEQSSADELFSDGLIRPLQIQQRIVSSIPKPKAPAISSNDSKENEQKSQQPRSSFWRIKRSSSLRCDDESLKKSSFWSLPLLSRSNSTGSVQNSRDGQNKNSQKQHKSSSASVNKSNSFSQKPPLKKKNNSYYGGSYGNIGNGVRISPVLNVHPSYISRGATNLFGLGSLLCNGKDKIKKKK